MTEADRAPLVYATPVPPPRPLLAAMVLALLSLGLIFLSGCFLIGVAVAFDLVGIPDDNPTPWTAGVYLFVGVLYLCVGVTFISGLWAALLSVRKLSLV